METTWNMLDHARMHKGVKPYKCPHCSKTFTQKGNMRKHSKLHLTPHVDARRKYRCSICNGGFTEKYNLMVGSLLILPCLQYLKDYIKTFVFIIEVWILKTDSRTLNFIVKIMVYCLLYC